MNPTITDNPHPEARDILNQLYRTGWDKIHRACTMWEKAFDLMNEHEGGSQRMSCKDCYTDVLFWLNQKAK